MIIQSPYHQGELDVQSRCNETDIAHKVSALFRDSIPDGAFQFIEQQPMCVIGSIDSEDSVWASILFSQPGFLYVQSARSLVIENSANSATNNDILWNNIQHNPNVGLLVIDLGTRRRLRISGRAKKISDTQYVIDVERAYSNCPKYIQRRFWKISNEKKFQSENSFRSGKKLDSSQRKLIENADTFFVASAHPEQGADASHRGGFPGFVKFVSDNQIRIPEYQGNSMFNTLGNFVSYPHAGLVFMDFERNSLLQLTGKPTVVVDTADKEMRERYWLLTIDSWRQYTSAFSLEWRFEDYSPFIPHGIR